MYRDGPLKHTHTKKHTHTALGGAWLQASDLWICSLCFSWSLFLYYWTQTHTNKKIKLDTLFSLCLQMDGVKSIFEVYCFRNVPLTYMYLKRVSSLISSAVLVLCLSIGGLRNGSGQRVNRWLGLVNPETLKICERGKISRGKRNRNFPPEKKKIQLFCCIYLF